MRKQLRAGSAFPKRALKTAAITAGAAACLFLAGVLLLRGCGAGEGGRRPAGTKVGMILLSGREDLGFSQSLGEAAEAVCAEAGVPLELYDQVPVGEAFRDLAEELIEGGCGLLLCDNVAYDADLAYLSAAHPDTFFFSASGTLTADNLSSCMRRTYQARYLTGLAAGSVSQSGEVGYVLAGLTPETIRQLNAFTIGVRKANPDAIVYVRQVNNWNDGEAAASETTALLDAHSIDVLAHHTSSIAPLRVADERGVAVVGCGYDNSALFPDTWLTGVVFHWEPLLADLIDAWRQGRFVGQRYQGGVTNGLVSITPLPGWCGPGPRNLAASEAERLAAGKYDVFFGPVRDVYGIVQVRRDENLSDEKILHGMYWFVDGVVLE